MSKQDDRFRPENIDEQIEQFSQGQEKYTPLASDKARLISNMRALHEEDAEIIQRVWERLAAHRAQKRQTNSGQSSVQFPLPGHMRQEPLKGPQFMETVVTKKQAGKKFSRTLELLAAVIIVGLLVSSLLVVFRIMQPVLTHLGTAPTPTPPVHLGASPTPTPTTQVDASGLYLSTKSGIDKISLQTGQVLWHIPLDLATTPFVVGNIVFFDYVASYEVFLGAADATTGKQLWHKNSGVTKSFLQANGVLYASICPALTGHPAQGITSCSIDAIRPVDGSLLWSFPTWGQTAWITIQSGKLYGVSYDHLFALNLTTSQSLWQKTLPYPEQEITQTPLVLNQTLYAASCNSTKATQAYAGCYFLAFNIANGTELWHTTAPASMLGGSLVTDPTASNGIIYYANLDLVYAVSASTGSTLWTYTACSGSCAVFELSATPDTLYIQINSDLSSLVALNLTHRSVTWSQNGGGKWLLSQGLVYVVAPQNQVKALNPSSGTAIKSYTDGTETITGLTLVTSNV